jgi:hypothetical protein
MYSLGCLVYAVHCKGDPPFKNHGSLGGLRDNAGRNLIGMDRLDRDLQGIYRRTGYGRMGNDYSLCSYVNFPHQSAPTESSHSNDAPNSFLLLIASDLNS